MSTTEILELISLISFILSGVSLLLAIFFWVKFRIPAVIGDLSGRTAKKSIERMRVTNEKSGKKVYKSSTTNLERGKLTGTMPDSKELIDDVKKMNKTSSVMPKENEETELLQENNAKPYVSPQSQTFSGETDVLNENDTEETGLLTEETMILEQEESQMVRPVGVKLVMLDEVMLVHTKDTIA